MGNVEHGHTATNACSPRFAFAIAINIAIAVGFGSTYVPTVTGDFFGGLIVAMTPVTSTLESLRSHRAGCGCLAPKPSSPKDNATLSGRGALSAPAEP